MHTRTENWMGHNIRFIWHNGEWWAVANDISKALEYATTGDMTRIVDKSEIYMINPQTIDTAGLRTLCITNENIKKMSLISECGIYDAIFSSHKKEAKEFKKWVYNVLKTLRQSSGLEGFQVFRMLDKEHNNEMMDKIKASFKNPTKVNYIKAHSITDKAVSLKFGYSKTMKKKDMSPEMLLQRQFILEDTVNLMSAVEQFGLDISVSKAIYDKYTH